MRTTIKVTLLSGVLSIMASACSDDREAPAAEQPATQQPAATQATITPSNEGALETEFNRLPKAVILRVPVDAQGNEQSDKVQMVSTDADVSAQSIEQEFANGQPISKLASNDNALNNSSTQSWRSPYQQQGQNYGNANGYGGQGTGPSPYGMPQRPVINSNTNFVNQQQYMNNSVNYGYNGYGTAGFYANGYANRAPGGSAYYGNAGWNGMNNSYYYNSYRPMASSLSMNGAWWQYQRPNCWGTQQFRYFHYPRAYCGNWSSCRGSRYYHR